MPGEINGEIQNAQPEIHQEIQVKKEGEVNKINELEKEVKDVENGVNKETKSEDLKEPEPAEETNGNSAHHEENSKSEIPASEDKIENKVEEHEQSAEIVESKEEIIEEKDEVEEKVETVTEKKSIEDSPVSENVIPQTEEPVSENLVCHQPKAKDCEKSFEIEEPVVEEVHTPKEPAVTEPPPVVQITPAETITVENSEEEKIAIENYAHKIESEKHKQVEKEYTKEVIESEVPARIVEEVKKGFESGSRGTLTGQAHQNGVPKKGSMFTSVDESSVKSAYEDVRNDSSETEWAVFKFEGAKIKCSASGSSFEKFQQQFDDKERAFGFIRVQTGDEMSKRQKFLFVTWVGPSVSVLQRAKMSTDKSFIKNIISNFAVELQLENQSEIDLKNFVNELNKAGGAHYGTGVRDN